LVGFLVYIATVSILFGRFGHLTDLFQVMLAAQSGLLGSDE